MAYKRMNYSKNADGTLNIRDTLTRQQASDMLADMGNYGSGRIRDQAGIGKVLVLWDYFGDGRRWFYKITD